MAKKLIDFLKNNYPMIIAIAISWIIIGILLYKSKAIKWESNEIPIKVEQTNRKHYEEDLNILKGRLEELHKDLEKLKTDQQKLLKNYQNEISKINNYTSSDIDSSWKNTLSDKLYFERQGLVVPR